jgi:hypothetical protein
MDLSSISNFCALQQNWVEIIRREGMEQPFMRSSAENEDPLAGDA